MENISFREKGIIISLVVTLTIYGYYFGSIFMQLWNKEINQAEAMTFFISTVILIIIAEAVLHSVLALGAGKEQEDPQDERDQLISFRATRNAHIVLSVGVFLSFAHLLYGDNSLLIAHFLLFFFIISEVVKYISQIFYYQRGF